MNHSPVLYVKYNDLQINDAKWLTKHFLHMIEWKGEGSDEVLEIGCGPGDVTNNILLPCFPEKVNIISSDISEEMINYAKIHYNNPKISYKVFDISKNIENIGKFDHIISLYCLQWVHNQKLVFKNIYNLLKPGGDMLVLLVATGDIYQLYEKIAQQPKWKMYLHNYQEFISPYHNSKHPQTDMQATLVEAGFIVKHLELVRKTYIFPNLQYLKEFLVAVNPFYESIPKYLHQEYFTDLLSLAKNINSTTIDGTKNVISKYSVIVAYAKKL